MRMDRPAIAALELLRNARPAAPGDNTLFGLANNTRTPGGRRLLTKNILQPMTNEEEINLHHDAVESLCGDEDVFRKLRDWLKEFDGIDLESISGWVSEDQTIGIVSSSGRHMSAVVGAHELSQAEEDLSRILGLKSYLKNVQALHQLLRAADVTDHLLESVASKTGADKTEPTLGLLAAVLQDDAAYSRSAAEIGHARMWAIRALPNDAIDLARAGHRRTREEAEAYFAEKLALFQEILGEAAAPKLFEDKDKGYCFKFKWADVRQYVDTDQPQPGEDWGQAKIGCVRVNLGVRKGEHYLCQTDRLLDFSQQVRVHSDIITKESDKYVLELRNAIAESGYVSDLTSIAKAVAQLDLVCSHAELTTTQGYVRPKIGKELALTKARHPIMEARRGFVPNDVFSGDDTKFVVVTGTNMGGKTTYIKTIALIQILAQIGCFVPAERAAVPICDRIFVRSATNDNAAGNAGTFAVEMEEMSVILHLVIIDELGRGTSTIEGLGLAAAMAEELVKKKSRVFFATHYIDLGKMLNAWYSSQVLNVHMSSTGSVEEGYATISLPHTVVAGPVRNWDYGLELASRYFPASLIESARHWSKHQQEQDDLNRAEKTADEMKIAAEVGVMAHIEQALSSQMSNLELAERLEVVADQYKMLEEGDKASNDNDEA
ncbi:putative DNA mismatch repair protein Msh4 [Cercophora samala]|uniref:DNA mismatch repair protein Msh4 n=1 Tax=Cercophora samala TaxID=330535 RepID=A0AA39ZHX3_9PEZI|nr:putative DNA mismatch repair protein Msh4 [Cercophora samala]